LISAPHTVNPQAKVKPQEKTIDVNQLNWFYRESTPVNPTDKPPVILLHGIPSHSYGWRNVLPALAEQGFRAIAPDLIGFGSSGKPEKRDFAYNADSYIEALGDWLQALEIPHFSLVTQGFLGTVGLQYALRHPEQIDRLAMLNTPLTSEAKLPWKMKQLGLPLAGEMMTQDPLLVDRTLEGGGGYRVADGDLDIYRRPFLKSSAAGRSLLAVVRMLNLAETMAELDQGFAHWNRPTLLLWGIRDPWLPVNLAETFAQTVTGAELVKLAEVGHYPQEDWHEKVSEALLPFLRKHL
jgi:pimeloyl-ACP methyl ester carboxylesterase